LRERAARSSFARTAPRARCDGDLPLLRKGGQLVRSLFVLLLSMLFACHSEPPVALEPAWGKQSCAQCGAVLQDPRAAAQALLPDDSRKFFDDVGCLAAWLNVSGKKATKIWQRVSTVSAGWTRPPRTTGPASARRRGTAFCLQTKDSASAICGSWCASGPTSRRARRREQRRGLSSPARRPPVAAGLRGGWVGVYTRAEGP